MTTDTYKTISNPSSGLYKSKGSRFIARAYPVESTDEVKEILAALRKEFHDARHHCYAYKLGPGEGVYRVNDDGEPANSAGKPILGQIQSFGLTNILIVVIRYFGGVLLGVGGLIAAYRLASKDCLEQAQIVDRTFNCLMRIAFPYPAMNEVMRLLKEYKAEIVRQESGIDCLLLIRLRESASGPLASQLQRIASVKAGREEL